MKIFKRINRLLSGVLILSFCSFASKSTINAQDSSLLHAPLPMSAVPPRPFAGPDSAFPLATAPRSSAETSAPYFAAPGESTGDRAPMMIDRASWTYQPAAPVRTFQKNDVVTIRVDEITRVLADGAANQRKQTLYETILTDWIRLTDFRLRPDPQANGDPAIAAESTTNYRAQSTIQSRESLTFNIAATVVDIRSNGSLVLEARKSVRVNDNLWETSLTGICRAQDIAPDNVVLSKDLIDLEIRKEDQGHLRDGYKRGWLGRWIDRVKPF